MTVDVRAVPRPGWDPLPGDGVVGVVGRVVVREDDFFVAELRFSERATIHEHTGERDTIVVCLDGEGFTSVAGAEAPLREGQQARASFRTTWDAHPVTREPASVPCGEHGPAFACGACTALASLERRPPEPLSLD